MSENLTSCSKEPDLIQGGMGVAVSDWRMANTVARAGERLGKPVLGVVSGTGIAGVMLDRLRLGDPDAMRALQAFPVPKIAQEIQAEYWLKKTSQFRLPPKPEVFVNGSEERKARAAELLVVANFAEVWLAKQGHSSPIGINYLEKVQLLHLPEIYGAMLAGVDYVLMGAGLPNQIPEILDRFAVNDAASYRIDVSGSGKHVLTFDPATIIPEEQRHALKRPKFLAIISLQVAAQVLAQKTKGEVNGFIVEGPTAGGHNAPPRGKEIDENGEPVYGPKDEPDLSKIQQLGRPFWLAGGQAKPESLQKAKEAGAVGIQVGSAFALSNESAMNEGAKEQLRKRGFKGELKVIASARVSPSGFPFQVAQLEGTLSEEAVYAARKRDCIYGYLVEPYLRSEGNIGFRCPAEHIAVYAAKGGKEEDTVGRRCLCAGLAATVGHAQPGQPEIVTLGKELGFLRELMADADSSYSAEDVIEYIYTFVQSQRIICGSLRAIASSSPCASSPPRTP